MCVCVCVWGGGVYKTHTNKSSLRYIYIYMCVCVRLISLYWCRFLGRAWNILLPTGFEPRTVHPLGYSHTYIYLYIWLSLSLYIYMYIYISSRPTVSVWMLTLVYAKQKKMLPLRTLGYWYPNYSRFALCVYSVKWIHFFAKYERLKFVSLIFLPMWHDNILCA